MKELAKKISCWWQSMTKPKPQKYWFQCADCQCWAFRYQPPQVINYCTGCKRDYKMPV